MTTASTSLPRWHHRLPAEEWANVATHGAGVALAVAALVLLVTHGAIYGDAWHIVTLAVFGVTLVLVYAASTLFHYATRPRVKAALRRLDHAAIYLLIAGTYTPFMLVTMRGGWGWTIFGTLWALAALGVVFKTRVAAGRFEAFSIAMYVVMGWIGLVAAHEFIRVMSTPGILWLLAGGVAYTAGVAAYLAHRIRFHHAIWHLFVIAGSTCHVIAMCFDVLPAA